MVMPMSLINKILKTIFPPVCVVCDKYAEYFCDNCQDLIDFMYFEPQLEELDRVQSLGFYTPPLSTVIKSLKYQSLHPLGSILGDLLYKHLRFSEEIDIVTEVPLHSKKLKQRGYNQAELIARQLAKRLNKPYLELLIRIKHTQNLASAKTDEQRKQLIQDFYQNLPDLREQMISEDPDFDASFFDDPARIQEHVELVCFGDFVESYKKTHPERNLSEEQWKALVLMELMTGEI